jgi:hypothetical protein
MTRPAPKVLAGSGRNLGDSLPAMDGAMKRRPCRGLVREPVPGFPGRAAARQIRLSQRPCCRPGSDASCILRLTGLGAPPESKTEIHATHARTRNSRSRLGLARGTRHEVMNHEAPPSTPQKVAANGRWWIFTRPGPGRRAAARGASRRDERRRRGRRRTRWPWPAPRPGRRFPRKDR